MNNLNRFINQQLGLSKLNNYDILIKRLACKSTNVFTSIFPDETIDEPNLIDTPIFACKFANAAGYKQVLALANEDGRIAICDTESQTPRLGGGRHCNAVFDLAWFPNDMKFVTAAGDHFATLFSINESEIKVEKIFQGHTRSLKSVACRTDDSSIFASGGRDGKIIVWDPRASTGAVTEIPDILMNYTHFPRSNRKVKGSRDHGISASSSVTGLVFQNENTLISCSSGDGLIKVWDMRKHYYPYDRCPIAKYSLPYAGKSMKVGFSNILLNSTATKLYASCLDNIIYCYNIGNYEPKPLITYKGHTNNTYYIKTSLSPDDRYLISGSSNFSAYIWDVSKSHPMVTLDGHTAEVTCVAWSGSKRTTTVVTCSDDTRHKFWTVGPEKFPDEDYSDYSDFAVSFKNSPVKNSPSRKRKLEENKDSEDEENNVKKSCYNEWRNFRNLRKRRLFYPLDNISEEPPAKQMPSTSSIIDNLPNFMVDGLAPHLNTSPIKRIEIDWLTKLRLKRQSNDDISGPSPKSPKISEGKSPRSRRAGSSTPTSSSKSPLLKFFKMTSSTCTSTSMTQQCRSKSPPTNLLDNKSPKSSNS